ncbi:ATPase [Bacillus sp. J14TS2]|uniref:BadF/BadG/BcrA/BcrD ATPase family protein n=1 Tax=Bacillus sp. J14TS2 TaxID=2807188 RepID=UPI001B085B94|nr:BadF/BadG/BcrA/BcrD ATPase family protein [Bacillus sp. J14TS2]GIN69867.1 ATPase [Bacillus sp. J14TS2]
MTYIIGIDAGGTKTSAVILDKQKNIVYTIETGFGNPQVEYERASTHIWEAVSACLQSEFGHKCKQIVAGIAGIEAKHHRANLEKFFKKRTALPVILVNDAILAYHAMLGEEDGILTIAGTGSISYGRNRDKEGYTGGWGHLLGDGGSAYNVVIQALHRITLEVDQGLSHSSLSQTLLQEIGVQKAEGIKEFIYQAAKGDIAALALPIFNQAVNGDNEAKQYFYQAGQQLAEQTAYLYKRLALSRPLKIACKGSLLEKNHYVQTEFKAGLSTIVGDIEWIRNESPSATGAVSVASKYGDERK